MGLHSKSLTRTPDADKYKAASHPARPAPIMLTVSVLLFNFGFILFKRFIVVAIFIRASYKVAVFKVFDDGISAAFGTFFLSHGIERRKGAIGITRATVKHGFSGDDFL